MAAAFHGPLVVAEDFAGNEDLREAISSAMEFWFSQDFTNADCLDHGGQDKCPCGTPGFWNTNWYEFLP